MGSADIGIGRNPSYKEQMPGLKEVMEQEFNQKISDELMEQLIDMKVKSALQ